MLLSVPVKLQEVRPSEKQLRLKISEKHVLLPSVPVNLCACAANDANHEATGGPLQELVIESVDSIIESIDSISRDEQGSFFFLLFSSGPTAIVSYLLTLVYM